MNRMNNDGIIEWHRPLVSNNYGEKWRRNRSSWLLSPETLCSHEPGDFLHGLRPRHLFRFIRLKYPIVILSPCMRDKKTPVSSSVQSVQIWLGALAICFGATQTTSAGERQTVGSTSMTNSGSADETESETRTRKTRQAACSRRRTWKARTRQKRPRIMLEADLQKMLKFNTPGMIRVNRIFQLFPAFFSILKINECALSKTSYWSC